MYISKDHSYAIQTGHIILSGSAGMGIADEELNEVVIPPIYDNVYVEGVAFYILSKRGKVGAASFDADRKPIRMIPCKYDKYQKHLQDYIFVNSEEIMYLCTKQNKTFDLVSVSTFGSFAFCEDANSYFLIDENGNELMREEKSIDNRDTFLAYYGKSKKGPIFKDLTNGNLLIPSKNGVYHRIMSTMDIEYPCIVNGKNIVSIISDGEKLGVFDPNGADNVTIPKYDNVVCELKVTGRCGAKKEEMSFEFAGIAAGEIIPIEEWSQS